ncbi:transcription factor, putative [Hepatocystis sp. ex Piliocolobus tephrosceles]|nr:transcription factor, putative [Hepatocystis sp. ex Piliocolobus tephrosceles]
MISVKNKLTREDSKKNKNLNNKLTTQILQTEGNLYGSQQVNGNKTKEGYDDKLSLLIQAHSLLSTDVTNNNKIDEKLNTKEKKKKKKKITTVTVISDEATCAETCDETCDEIKKKKKDKKEKKKKDKTTTVTVIPDEATCAETCDEIKEKNKDKKEKENENEKKKKKEKTTVTVIPDEATCAETCDEIKEKKKDKKEKEKKKKKKEKTTVTVIPDEATSTCAETCDEIKEKKKDKKEKEKENEKKKEKTTVTVIPDEATCAETCEETCDEIKKKKKDKKEKKKKDKTTTVTVIPDEAICEEKEKKKEEKKKEQKTVYNNNDNNKNIVYIKQKDRYFNQKTEYKDDKKVRFQDENISNEELINFFITDYKDKLSIENNELCEIITGKRFSDIGRLTKNALNNNYDYIMYEDIQKKKKNYCKQCGYIYNYEDYMCMFMNLMRFAGLPDNKNSKYTSCNNENIIKCIYCGYEIDCIESTFGGEIYKKSIELLSYREKYIFDQNKKKYWKNKIVNIYENTSLFKEGNEKSYNISYEECKDCGNEFLYFVNIQTRSADEGSTIIYFCPACKKQTSVSN